MGLIKGTLSYEDVASADLVIEAVFEDLEVKRQVFETLDANAKPGAILASNTSTLDLDKIAAFTRRPQDVVGLHFFSPANVTKLLEVVRGAKTAKDVLATSLGIAKQIKKIGVVAGVCDGFIGNRMLRRLLAADVVPARRGRTAAADRQGAGEVRLRDGSVPRRAISPATTSAGPSASASTREHPGRRLSEERGPHLRTGPLRPEDRRRVVRLQAGRPHADAVRRGDADHPRGVCAARRPAAQDQRPGDRRACRVLA